MTTIKDIARELHLSPSTVSRALQHSSQIPLATQERVRATALRMGYHPHAQASALRTGNTHVLGLVVSSIKNPFFSVLAFEIEQAATQLGYTLMLANANEDPQRQETALQTMLSHNIDGLLIVPTEEPSETIRAQLKHIPLVSIDRTFPSTTCSSVVATSTQAAQDLAHLLWDRGYRHPVCLCGPTNTSTGRERTLALSAALSSFDFEDITLTHASYDEQGGRLATREVLESSLRPDVVICGSGEIALGALAELEDHGLSIGTDVGFVTFDALDWLRVYKPPLAVIDTHIAEVARKSIDILHAHIEHFKATGSPSFHISQTELPSELIVRRSLERR